MKKVKYFLGVLTGVLIVKVIIYPEKRAVLIELIRLLIRDQ